jgi:uncharacterized delta-60 repeat protein
MAEPTVTYKIKGELMIELVGFNHASVVGKQARLQKDKLKLRTVVQAALLACAVLIASWGPAMAQAGKLDSTFGVGGVFTDTAAEFGTAVAMQSDGKIVAGGQIGFEAAVVRLNTNGALDPTFGSGGTASISFPGDDFGGAQIIGLAIQTDGKIVAGISNFEQGFDPMFIIARLNVNGSLDSTFGSGGIVETQIGQFGAPDSVLSLQPDGRILVAGSGSLARYDTDGQLDITFGNDGVAPVTFGSPTSIALQPDGKILLAAGGSVVAFAAPTPGVTLNQVAGIISRYNTNGSLDTSFGISGQAASVVVAGAITVENDGVCSSACKILVGGTLLTNLNNNNSSVGAFSSGNGIGFGLARLNSNGSVDTYFGQGGAVSTSFGPSVAGATSFALALQANGEIVAAGSAGQLGNPAGFFVPQAGFALARYTSTGGLDTTFGSSGEVTTAFKTNQASIYGLALQSDGKIVAVGTSLESSQNPGGQTGGLVVARYLSK